MRQLEERQTVVFEGYGDLTLNELLPVLGDIHIGQDITIITPNVPRYLLSGIQHMLAATVVKKGKNTLRHPHMTITTDTSEQHSPGLKELADRVGDRITLNHQQLSDTMILLQGELWFGNVGHGKHFHGIVTREPFLIRELTSGIRKS